MRSVSLQVALTIGFESRKQFSPAYSDYRNPTKPRQPDMTDASSCTHNDPDHHPQGDLPLTLVPNSEDLPLPDPPLGGLCSSLFWNLLEEDSSLTPSPLLHFHKDSSSDPPLSEDNFYEDIPTSSNSHFLIHTPLYNPSVKAISSWKVLSSLSSYSSLDGSPHTSSRLTWPDLPPESFFSKPNSIANQGPYVGGMAYTPSAGIQLREVQEGKSLLSAPIGRDLLPEVEGIPDVKVIRSWREKPQPERSGRRISVPPYVSETLYRTIEEHLPHVAAERVLRRALVYLKLVAVPDPRSGYLPLHESAVAHIREVPSLADSHGARVYDLAVGLKKAVENDLGEGEAFFVVPHRPHKSCVQVTPFDLPEPVEEAFAEERDRIFLSCSTVNLQTGDKERPEHRKRRSEERRKKAERTAKTLGVPNRLRRLQLELHGLPKKRFRTGLKSAKGELVRLIKKRRREQDHRGPTPYLSQLRAIADVPLPLYKFTGSTLRLTPAGPSIAALPKKMRRAVFDDYLEVDMSSAQLAIAASAWRLGKVRQFLADCMGGDKSWWTELIGWLRQELPAPMYCPEKHFGAVKGVLKGFTYGLFYGMKRENLRRLGTPHGPSSDKERYYKSIRMMNRLFLSEMMDPVPQRQIQRIGDALFRHPLVDRLFRRRQQIFSKIKAQGSITDCFGRSIDAESRDSNSVLAEYMQNAELMVMLPVGETILSDGDLRFGLWQHDGVTMAPRRRKPWAYRNAVEQAREALQKGCADLEEALDVDPIETELTVDYGAEYL